MMWGVRQWMNDVAATHRWWGYKRAWACATGEGITLGAVRSGARTRTEGPARTSAQSPAPRRVPNPVVTASAPGQVWAIDVQFDSDRKGSVFKTCHAIDAFTRQHPPFRVKRPMGAADVIDMLGWLSWPMGTPGAARR